MEMAECLEEAILSREIELKLEVDPGGGERVRSSAALAGLACSAEAQSSTYFDTADGRLAKAGFSLRVRSGGGRTVQTVKRQKAAAAGLFDRAEWEWELDGAPAPDLRLAAGTPMAPLLDDAVLLPVLRTGFDRRTWMLAPDGCRISVTLDEGTIAGGGREAPLREIELELAQGERSALFDAAAALAADAPLRLGVLSKAERARRLAEGKLGRAVKAEPVALPPDASVAGGFAAIAYSCLRHYRLNEAVLLEAADADALHQMRVALRRLRSSLSLFGGIVRDADHARLREELRWFTGRFGQARNFDVFSKRLPKRRRRPRAGEEDVREALSAARERSYADALNAIRSRRGRELMLALVRWIELGGWRDRGKARRPLLPFAAARMEKRWGMVAAAGERLAALDPEERHRLRIEVKKMRYAAEFLASLHGARGVAGRRKRFVSAARDLQESLGALNDAATARELVARLPLRTADGRAFASTLIGREPDEAEGMAAAAKAFARMREAAGYWR